MGIVDFRRMAPETELNVFYLASSRVPSRHANSIHVMKMCQAFAQLGHRPTLVIPYLDVDLSNKSVRQKVWDQYGIIHPFTILGIHPRKGFRHHDYYLRAVWRAHRQQADLVFTRHLAAGFWAARTGLPTIYEAHYPPVTRSGRFYLRHLIGGPGFKKIIVISQRLKEIFLNKFSFLAPHQLLVEPDGVDLERFENVNRSAATYRAALDLPVENLAAGYAGHLYAGRGVEIILDAARALPNITFLIMGGHSKDVNRYRREYADVRNARFLGFIDNGKLPEYLAACDFLLMPYQKEVKTSRGSLNSVEWMSPMKMFEYMAINRLIISSDLPVLREILDERIALLCRPDKVDDWIGAIQKGVDDQSARLTLAAAAAQKARQFTWQKRIQRIMQEAKISCASPA